MTYVKELSSKLVCLYYQEYWHNNLAERVSLKTAHFLYLVIETKKGDELAKKELQNILNKGNYLGENTVRGYARLLGIDKNIDLYKKNSIFYALKMVEDEEIPEFVKNLIHYYETPPKKKSFFEKIIEKIIAFFKKKI